MCCASRLHRRGLLVVNAQEAREQTQGLSHNQYTLGLRGSSPRCAIFDHKNGPRPCTKLSKMKAQTLLVSHQRDNATKDPSCRTRCAQGYAHRGQGKQDRQHPQPGKRTLTPWSYPWCRTPSRTKRYDKPKETLQTSHPLAPSAKGWTTCSPCLFARILFITTPQRDFSGQNSPRMMGLATPSTIPCIINSS